VAVSRCALARFQGDLEALLRWSTLQPGSIELRIAEKTLALLENTDRVIAQLTAPGASVVIDEFGRGLSSLGRIARLPLKALQIERRFVLAAARRPSVMRFCQAAVAIARSYCLTPIASGIDCDATRQQMLAVAS
jgi:cyclic di-GMP phosphodiesterase Gmr